MIILNFKKVIPLVISIVVLICVIAFSAKNTENITIKTDSKQTVSESKTTENGNATIDSVPLNTEEMRGVWITYMELSMVNEQNKSETAFRDKFDEIAKNCRGYGFNTLIVQVRPFGDALYKSSYYPWSHILTGTQGEDPGYDALEIMCEICNEYGLKIHAWINPYRVTLNETPSELSSDNPYIKNKSLGIETESGIILDPSDDDARTLITDGVEEIVKNYDVDGIQFDDYFYPTDIENNDESEYKAYVSSVAEENCMVIDEWRKTNVNMLICEVYRRIHSIKNDVMFGISPQGNISNNDKLYADVKSWSTCKGFVDYICPQIYFSLENPALTFEDCLESWSSLEYDESVDLYVGLAGYKACTDDDEGTWQDDDDILAQEYDIIKNEDTTGGFMLYSYSSLIDENSLPEMQNLQNILL